MEKYENDVSNKTQKVFNINIGCSNCYENMRGGDVFLLKFWRLTAVFLILCTAMIGSCSYKTNIDNNNAINDLVAKGVPIDEAKCAIRADGGDTNNSCYVKEIKRTPK